MITIFFEIVERSFDRYSWLLVVYHNGRRRVLARSNRDFRSPHDAAQAAERLQEIIGDAEIVCAFTPSDFTFEILDDAVPLKVGSADDVRDFRPRARELSAGPVRPGGYRPRSGGGTVGQAVGEPRDEPESQAAAPPAPDTLAQTAQAQTAQPEAAPEAEAEPSQAAAQTEATPPTRQRRPAKQQPPPAPRNRGTGRAPRG